LGAPGGAHLSALLAGEVSKAAAAAGRSRLQGSSTTFLELVKGFQVA